MAKVVHRLRGKVTAVLFICCTCYNMALKSFDVAPCSPCNQFTLLPIHTLLPIYLDIPSPCHPLTLLPLHPDTSITILPIHINTHSHWYSFTLIPNHTDTHSQWYQFTPVYSFTLILNDYSYALIPVFTLIPIHTDTIHTDTPHKYYQYLHRL